MSSNIVITMARQYGSGGKTIGAMLAKELGSTVIAEKSCVWHPRKAELTRDSSV